MKLHASLRLLALFALALGCANESERPPPPTCLGDCGLSPGLGAGLSMPGDDDAGTDVDAGTAIGVELTGDVLILDDDFTFSSGTVLTDMVNLTTTGADFQDVLGAWDGSDAFALPNVRSAATVWVYANPANSVADDALPALEPVTTTTPDANGIVTADLALVRSSTLENIFDLSSVPITMDTTKGQIIVLLKTSGTATPTGLAGVSAQTASAENVIYGASNSFSDVATVTDNTGVVLLANVTATAWPGAVVEVQLGGAATSGLQIRAVSGAVTLVTFAP